MLKLIEIIVFIGLTGVSLLPGQATAQHWTSETDAVRESARALTADLYGNYFNDGMALAYAFDQALSGPPDPGRSSSSDNLAIYSGCRVHSCDEKAAAVLEGQTVRALGLIHYNCSNRRREETGKACLDVPMLTIVQRVSSDDPARDILVEWARSKRNDIRIVEVISR